MFKILTLQRKTSQQKEILCKSQVFHPVNFQQTQFFYFNIHQTTVETQNS